MAPSIVSALTSAAVLLSSVAQVASYSLTDTYDVDNFFDKFQPFVSDHTTGNYNDVDPTSGYVNYRTESDARTLGILKTIGNEIRLGVDSENKLNPAGFGRSSLRLESRTKYRKGLFIADFSYLPKPVCGTWPAFWTVGLPWPMGGEIDIYEAWNLDEASRFVMHTDPAVGSCKIDGKEMTAEFNKPDCANSAPGQAFGEGCAAFDSSLPYASPEGGVYAMEWTSTAIKIWAWTHDKVPKDLATIPNPENWGAPRYRTSSCEIDKVFDDAQLILNIGFCGVAGQADQWGTCAAQTGEADCRVYVANNPEAFVDSYFQVRSIKVYQKDDGKKIEPPVSQPEDNKPEQPEEDKSKNKPEDNTEQPGEDKSQDSKLEDNKPEDKPEDNKSNEKPEDNESVDKPEDESEDSSENKPEENKSEGGLKSGSNDSQDGSKDGPKDGPKGGSQDESKPPHSTSVERLTTLTTTETTVSTIASCPPEAASNCPALIGSTTEVVVVRTTVCPVADVSTTIEVLRTFVSLVSSCAPDGSNCQAVPTTIVSTELIATVTPVPVTDASGYSALPQQSAPFVLPSTLSTEPFAGSTGKPPAGFPVQSETPFVPSAATRLGGSLVALAAACAAALLL